MMKKGLPIDFRTKGVWHIHTTYTDGKNNIFDYCDKAMDLGIPLLAFTEHVRTVLDYDFNNYTLELEVARRSYDRMIIITGIETKLLPLGFLDVFWKILNKVEYVVASVHSFPKDKELYLESLLRMLRHESVDTWGHPFRFAKLNDIEISLTEANILFNEAKINNVMIEPVHMHKDVAHYHNVTKVNGEDIHSVKEMEELYEKQKI